MASNEPLQRFACPEDYLRRIDQNGVAVYVVDNNLLSRDAVNALLLLGHVEKLDPSEQALAMIRQANLVIVNETGFTGDQLMAARNGRQTQIDNFTIRYAMYLK